MIILFNNICCVFGHRTINETPKLKNEIYTIIEGLITGKSVDTFLFGSKSRFDELCYEVITALKEKYPYIKRIYVRAEYPHINESYKNYLLRSYEDTYYPERIINAGRAVYVERNFEMIDKSKFCIVYYEEQYSPSNRKSGTKIAYEYALRHNKIILKLPK